MSAACLTVLEIKGQIKHIYYLQFIDLACYNDINYKSLFHMILLLNYRAFAAFWVQLNMIGF